MENTENVKTNQIIKRQFNDTWVSQRSQDKFFNATELLKVHNTTSGRNKALPEFWSNQGTSNFIEALENQIASENIGNSLVFKTYNTTSGRNGGTWMHPYLFVKFAMWLSPELEVKVIKWVYDNLIEFRDQAGNHYKEMCDVISERYEEFFDKKADPLVYVREANLLNLLVFGNIAGKQRNTASEAELELMNKLQLANIKMIKGGMSKEDRHNNLKTFASLYK